MLNYYLQVLCYYALYVWLAGVILATLCALLLRRESRLNPPTPGRPGSRRSIQPVPQRLSLPLPPQQTQPGLWSLARRQATQRRRRLEKEIIQNHDPRFR